MPALQTALAVGSEAMRVNPLRTALSTLGVIIGVASMVAVLSLGDGMEDTMRAQLGATTPLQSIGIATLTSEEVDGDRFPLRDTAVLTEAELAELVRIPGVASWSQSVFGRAEVRRVSSDVRRMTGIVGERGTRPFAAVAEGRGLVATDSGQRVAVLGAQLARRLRTPDSASLLGQWVTAGSDTLRIVGILADGGPPAPVMHVPFDVAMAMTSRRGRALPDLTLQTSGVEHVEPVLKAVGSVLGRRGTDWQRRFSVESYRTRAAQAAQGILIFKLLMGAITGISLLVGGIGIMNVLLASVSERTREIGIRRAAGATRRDILYQFLAEAVTISGLGAALGIVLGLTGAFAITAAIRHFADAVFIRASFSWSSVFAAGLAAVLIGLAFGTWPARRAAALSPIDAIRHE